SFKGNSSRVNVNEIRPTNPVLDKMFFSIHDEAEPHKIKMSCEFFLKWESQAFFNLPKKSESQDPIQQISSNSNMILPFLILYASNQNKSFQSFALILGKP